MMWTLLASSALLLPACSRESTEHIPVDGLTNTPPDPPTGPAGTFLSVGALITPRTGHRAVTLVSGDVLVAGGEDAGAAPLASAELYDYHHGEFLALSQGLATARVDCSATLMADGKVLFCGGSDGTNALDSAEIFDPASLGFSAAAGLLTAPRSQHVAIRLPNDNVLLCGGRDAAGAVLATCEIYDRSTGQFLPCANPMAAARAGHAAALLDTGKVLVTGGVDATGAALASAEIFDPGAGLGDQGTFAAPGTALSAARAGHQAIKINQGAYAGHVLLFGGFDGTLVSPLPHTGAEAFDPFALAGQGAFAPVTDTMAATRIGFTATMLTGGSVILLVGGNDLNRPELFDAYAGTSGLGVTVDGDFQRTQDGVGTDTVMAGVTTGRRDHAAAWLPNGTVLLCGGEDGGTVTGTAELYNP